MKKSMCLIVFFIFILSNPVCSHNKDGCLLIQKATSIMLYNVEDQSEFFLIETVQNDRFSITYLNDKSYIIIYDERKDMEFRSKKINQFNGSVYTLNIDQANGDTILVYVGQVICTRLDSGDIYKVYTIKINNENVSYTQYEANVILDEEQGRFPFHRSNSIKEMVIYSSGGNLYMQNKNETKLLIKSTIKNNPKAMNGLYFPNICNNGGKFCFSRKKNMNDNSFQICEYTFCDNKVIELPIKGTSPLYSVDGNYLIVKKSNLFYIIYSFRENKIIKNIKGCINAAWITL